MDTLRYMQTRGCDYMEALRYMSQHEIEHEVYEGDCTEQGE